MNVVWSSHTRNPMAKNGYIDLYYISTILYSSIDDHLG